MYEYEYDMNIKVNHSKASANGKCPNVKVFAKCFLALVSEFCDFHAIHTCNLYGASTVAFFTVNHSLELCVATLNCQTAFYFLLSLLSHRVAYIYTEYTFLSVVF